MSSSNSAWSIALETTAAGWGQTQLLRIGRILSCVLSAHLVAIAFWLVYTQHAQAALFGREDEISGAPLLEWVALLLYTGVTGLLASLCGVPGAVKHALGCWLLLSLLHIWYLLAEMALAPAVVPTTAVREDAGRRWTAYKVVAQLLTDALSTSYLVFLLQRSHKGAGKSELEGSLEPLLPKTSVVVV
ncbi:hypothetical protein BBJ28_00005973 [Nothophytophthora sp. Chile5]|nr:hypothetical protein BBJ28_00005973 [Nothophytophthora sp. Chile5]